MSWPDDVPTPTTQLKFQRSGQYFAFYRLSFRFEKTAITASVDMIASKWPLDPGPDGDGGLPLDEAA